MISRAMAIAVAALLVSSGPAPAQNITSSSIDGVVTDQSGGALPGVTVTATSPALQMPQIVTTSDAQGFYRFKDIPRGTYELRFELQGFHPLIRQVLVLYAGFAARVNRSLTVGSPQETVAVSGARPVS